MRIFTKEERISIYKKLEHLCKNEVLLRKKISQLIDDRMKRSKDSTKNFRGYIINRYVQRYNKVDTRVLFNNKEKKQFLKYRDYNSEKSRNEIIDETHYKMMLIQNYFKEELTQEILFLCLDAIIEYNYFNDVIENKYDPEKIRDDFKKIERFLQSDTKIDIKIPKHSQDIFRDTYKELTEIHNTNKKDTKDLLNQLLENVNNYGLTKNTRIRRKKVADELICIFENVIKNPQCKRVVKDEEKQKELLELNKLRETYK